MIQRLANWEAGWGVGWRLAGWEPGSLRANKDAKEAGLMFKYKPNPCNNFTSQGLEETFRASDEAMSFCSILAFWH